MLDSAASLLERALSLHRRGVIAEAAVLYSATLEREPRNPDALCYLAMIFCQPGRLAEGIALARRALDVTPECGLAHNLIGMAQHRLRHLDEALASFDAAISCQPDLAAAHGNRASVLSDLNRLNEAIESYDHAVALNPSSFEDWCNRGATLHALNRLEEAIDSFDQAIVLAPNVAAAHVNRGNVLSLLDRFEEAVAAYDRAIALERNLAQAYADKGLALKGLGRLGEAQTLIESALAMQPNNATVAFALAQILLLQGQWRRAWQHYERREQMPKPPFQPLLSPRWNGEWPDHYRLVVMTEQGLGDAIQFGRYASVLAGRGYAVTVLTRSVLLPLLSTLPGVERVVASPDELSRDSRPFRWIPLMSVPRALHLTPNAVPLQQPYLSANSRRVAVWRERLGGTGFKIGIAWGASGRSRSAPLANFEPLAEIEGVRLVSLQKLPSSAQIDEVPFGGRIERPTDETDTGAESLLDTAAIMMSLDLIVSVDTMAAHLAGALGRPVFVALRRIAEWRWLLDRDDSPFYPTMRLFRQPVDGDWNSVCAQIAGAVRARVHS
jgi:tetratricopeptide (TPR) repeat protein